MTPEQAVLLRKVGITAFEREVPVTRKVLAAVPDDQGGYKPHEKCKSAIELVHHIALCDVWFLESIINAEFAKPDDSWISQLSTASEVVAAYDARIPELIAKVKALSGDHLIKDVRFHEWTNPCVAYLNFALVHTIHHRGQLSVYLRPMGAKVPSIYGGSADEPMAATA